MQKFIGKMARMYPLLILMGFMMVVIAFIVGYFNSQTAAAYFAEAKAVRESIGLWLPYFKFLGLGLILGGIVMALRVIIDDLQDAGKEVLANLPESKRLSLPKPPWYGPLMPMVMMLGEVVFIVALIVSIGLASSANQLFANPLPDIDAAAAGSALLTQLQGIRATFAWLVPFKFFGVATQFLAIAMGLSTIIYILTHQTDLIAKGIDIARAGRADTKEPERVPA
jgi:hypothetical protein